METYLIQNNGEGVQHLALYTSDIFNTLSLMKSATKLGIGFEFMDPLDQSYYKRARERIGFDVLSEEQYILAEHHGVLIDKDEEGILLQIFTKPITDQKTVFFEIIQRIGCVVEGNTQKPGCGGFGKGNFKELFKQIEDYEKIFIAEE